MIIVDTREQLPLWEAKEFNIIKKKLDEGDYTTEKLLNKAHIERKSGIDLYGSIIQGHDRFRAELMRAIEKDIKLVIMVECAEDVFYRKVFKGGYRLKCPGSVLKKILQTMQIKYNVEVVWCEDRDDLRDKMLLWFAKEERLLEGQNLLVDSVTRAPSSDTIKWEKPKNE
ncbi:MAG: ERCC4 domain-containing protein [Candidatus Heimdallarchaeaceae archaeon]